ncbi:MAG: ABC transporter ATP-binding protein [Oceanococcaceae bacterium]
MTPALDVREVSKAYGPLKALDNVSLSIAAGDFFGLLGPNGAGKSTLIGIIAGLLRANSGAVTVMGHDTVTQYRQARRSLGVVPQELVYDPFFTVERMLRNQAGYFGCGRASWPWVDELIEGLELGDKRHTSLRALSGGMKRRVLIAQALVHRPPVVILDEPTAGVDVELRRTLWQFTRRLHAEGHTIVLTTHYLEEAESLCRNIAILNRGQVLVRESTRDLLSRHPFRFLRVKTGGRELPQSLNALHVGGAEGDWELRLDKTRDDMGAVLDVLNTEAGGIRDVATRDASLEDVFVDMTTAGAQR